MADCFAVWRKLLRCGAAAALIVDGSARAQPAPENTPPGAPRTGEPQGQQAPAPSSDNPGLIKEIGKLLDPTGLFSKTPAPAPVLPAPPQPDAAKPPENAPPSSPLVPQIVKGRALCPSAANGAPDCKAGADKLCQGKGFKDGRSLDTDAAHDCAVTTDSSGKRSGFKCGTNNYVTRAFCQ